MGKSAAMPERTCIVSGEMLGKEALLRFVVGPDDTIVPDVAGKLPGRGLWVMCRRPVLEQAIKKNAFRRAARRAVTVPPGLPAQTESLLAERAVQSLAMARKAGQAVAGFEKVRAALMADQVVAVIHALDVAPDSARKLLIDKAIPLHYMSRDILAPVMGRDNLAHIALLRGAAGENSGTQWQRFSGFIT